MAFDEQAFKEMLENYPNDCVEIEIIRTSSPNPVLAGGAGSLGVNIDVGETRSFNLQIINNGPIGLQNVFVEITSRRGKVSASYSGFAAHWIGPFRTTLEVRPFNLAPHQTYLHKHEINNGDLFGYNAQEPTGGSDNARDIETLLTASIIKWEPDLKVGFELINGPTDTFDAFIQRS